MDQQFLVLSSEYMLRVFPINMYGGVETLFFPTRRSRSIVVAVVVLFYPIWFGVFSRNR